MEQSIQAKIVEIDAIANMLMLIDKYRQLEKAPIQRGIQLIKQFAPSHLVDHLSGHWKSKKQQFGSFYLNLDYKYQLAILNSFGIYDKADDEFVSKEEEDPRSMIFEKPTGFMSMAKKVLTFFENHGIDADPVGDGSIKLSSLPVNAKKRYGNSANWGDYIQNMLMTDSMNLITGIINQPEK